MNDKELVTLLLGMVIGVCQGAAFRTLRWAHWGKPPRMRNPPPPPEKRSAQKGEDDPLAIIIGAHGYTLHVYDNMVKCNRPNVCVYAPAALLYGIALMCDSRPGVQVSHRYDVYSASGRLVLRGSDSGAPYYNITIEGVRFCIPWEKGMVSLSYLLKQHIFDNK